MAKGTDCQVEVNPSERREEDATDVPIIHVCYILYGLKKYDNFESHRHELLSTPRIPSSIQRGSMKAKNETGE